jgi:hypothetical protein
MLLAAPGSSVTTIVGSWVVMPLLEKPWIAKLIFARPKSRRRRMGA